MNAEPSDERLMVAFQKGDPAAFELLVARHRSAIFNFILRQLKERARAEDVLQETWLKIIRGAGDYRSQSKFVTWAYTIARNLCVDSVRKEHHRRAEALEAPPSSEERGHPPIDRVVDPGPGPERQVENVRLQATLEKALANLPDEQREVFWLREYAGLPFKEIAVATSTPENTVKSRMRYALEGLRAYLEQSGIEEPGNQRWAAG